MMKFSADLAGGLTYDDRWRFDEFVLRFERDWTPTTFSEQMVTLGSATDHVTRLAVVEMAAIDIERQWHVGNHVSIEDYLSKVPHLRTDERSLLCLVAAECQARLDASQTINELELQRRFPQWAQGLARVFAEIESKNRAAESGDTSRSGSIRDTESLCSTDSILLPEVFGRYRVVRKLAKGGMGSVYLAHDTKLRRPVALKLPHVEGAGKDDHLLERFYEEAQAVAKLDEHPNICSIHDVGQIEGLHYIAMAYIDGPTLAQYLDIHEPVGQREAANIVTQVAEALQFAHQHGVIHRDLKPANIMMNQRDEPVVMDFGLARHVNPTNGIRMTRKGELLGSPAYMSPEQAAGDSDRVGSATDIYSLGVMLYELVTGSLPFRGTTLGIIQQIGNSEPKRPSELRADLNPALEAICLKMMAKKQTDRYQTMQNVVDDLKQYLGSTLSPQSTAGQLARRRGLVVAAVTLAALLTVGLALRSKQPAIRFDEKYLNQTLPPEGTEITGARDIGNPLDVLRRDQIPGHHLSAAGLGDPAKAPRQLVGVFGDSRLMHWNKTGPSSLEFSSDDSSLIAASWDGTVAIWNVQSGQLTQAFVVDPAGLYSLALRPRSSEVALGSGSGRLHLLDLETGNTKRLKPSHAGPSFFGALSFHPRGDWLLSGTNQDRSGWYRHLTTGEVTPVASQTGIRGVAFNPDGALLATVGGDSAAKLWDPTTGSQLRIMSGRPGEFFNAVAFSPDGSTLVTGCCNDVKPKLGGNVRLWDLETGSFQRALDAPGGWVWSLRFSPDGTWLADGRQAGVVNLWDRDTWTLKHTLTATATTPITPTAKGKRSLAFSSNSQLLASAGGDNAISVWDLSSEKPKPVHSSVFGRFHTASVRPDSQLVVAAGDNGVIGLWNLRTGEERRIRAEHQTIHRILFSPNGEVFATAGDSGSVRFWEADSGETSSYRTIETGRKGPVSDIAFSSVEPVLAIATASGSLGLWNWQVGAQDLPALSLCSGGALAVAFSHDGKWLAVGGAEKPERRGAIPTGTLHVVNRANGSVVNSIPFEHEVRSVAFHSTRVAVISSADVFRDDWARLRGLMEARLVVVDAFSGHRLLSLKLPVTGVSFSHDGSRLLLPGLDGKLRVIDVATGDMEEITIAPPRGLVSQALFGPNDRHAITANHNGSVYVLRLSGLGAGRRTK